MASFCASRIMYKLGRVMEFLNQLLVQLLYCQALFERKQYQNLIYAHYLLRFHASLIHHHKQPIAFGEVGIVVNTNISSHNQLRCKYFFAGVKCVFNQIKLSIHQSSAINKFIKIFLFQMLLLLLLLFSCSLCCVYVCVLSPFYIYNFSCAFQEGFHFPEALEKAHQTYFYDFSFVYLLLLHFTQ